MAASPDSAMSDDLPLDPHGQEHIYDVAHSFLYRVDDATSALWRPLSPAPQPHAADIDGAPPPTSDGIALNPRAEDLVPMATSDAASADTDSNPHSMVNLATMGMSHPRDASLDENPAPLTRVAFGSDQLHDFPPADAFDDAGLAGAPDGATASAAILPAAWNQDSDDGGGGGGGNYTVAEYTSDEEWQAAEELHESEGDEEIDDDGAARGMWVDDDDDNDDDDDEEEEEDPQDIGGLGDLGAYNTRTLVDSLLSRVGLHRLVASQHARRSHARSQQGPPRVEACPVPFLKGGLSAELRALTDPMPPRPHAVHLLRSHCPATLLSLDELNQPMHDLCAEPVGGRPTAGGPGDANAARDSLEDEGPLRSRRSRGRRPSWLGAMGPFLEMDGDDGIGMNRRTSPGRAMSWQSRLQRVVSQRIARSRQEDRGSEEEGGVEGAGDKEVGAGGSASRRPFGGRFGGLPWAGWDGAPPWAGRGGPPPWVRRGEPPPWAGRGGRPPWAGRGGRPFGQGFGWGGTAGASTSQAAEDDVDCTGNEGDSAVAAVAEPPAEEARRPAAAAAEESAEAGASGAVAAAAEGDGAGGDEAGHVIPPQPNVACMLHSRECGHDGRGGWSRAQQRHVSTISLPPVHRVREIEARAAKAYIGKFSERGDLFVAAYQDRRLRVFDTTGDDFVLRKDVEVRRFRWTVTDTAISRDSGFLLYCSISPQAHLVRIGSGGANDVVHSVSNITEVHEEIDFLAGAEVRMSIGVWSLAWSPSDSIVAAGTSQPGIILYDLAAERRLTAAACHHDDVNAVAFADEGGNLLVSGSDDSRLFLLDRRTMRGDVAAPVGQLLGHTEGVTHVDARGDGRFVISNAKDSTMRLWDLRCMTPGSKAIPEQDLCSLSHFDYRWHEYPHAGMVPTRPIDNSIMAFRGHKVLQTLIRSYWGPPATTGGRCIYTGSADGSVYVYDTITGHVLHELRHHSDVVRDCTWHPHRPQLVSVSWDGSIVEWGPREGPPFSPSMMVHDYW